MSDTKLDSTNVEVLQTNNSGAMNIKIPTTASAVRTETAEVYCIFTKNSVRKWIGPFASIGEARTEVVTMITTDKTTSSYANIRYTTPTQEII